MKRGMNRSFMNALAKHSKGKNVDDPRVMTCDLQLTLTHVDISDYRDDESVGITRLQIRRN